MEVQIIFIVPAIVVMLIGGTVFSAWRAERAAERDEREDEVQR